MRVPRETGGKNSEMVVVEERVRISGKWGRATDFVVDRVTVREELGPGGLGG